MTGTPKAPSPPLPSLRTCDVIEIWPGGIGPGSERCKAQLTITERSNVAFWPDRMLTGITRSTLTAFVPDRPNGTVVIVAPGGAYGRIVLDKEAAEMALWLNALDVTALLLQYRLPAEGHVNGKDAPLADAQRAIRHVRHHALDWGLDPERIGFLGASAAGHMGALLGAKFDQPVYTALDPADHLSARPDFMILLYPVISMDEPAVHLESRINLLGELPPPELIKNYSADQHVNPASPPTLLVVADDDPVVPSANSVLYHEALKRAGISTVLHRFPEGGHGFGIRGTRQLPVSNWPHLATEWLRAGGFIH